MRSESIETLGGISPRQHLRVYTFGRFQIEWCDPQTSQITPLPHERLRGQNAATALGLLKTLLSCPDRFATRAFLNEQFWPDSTVKRAEERLNDVVSSLRTLLRPKGSSEMLVHFVYGTNGRGAGFRLDSYPQLWCDADAFEWYVKHALLLDQRGQDATACWEHAYVLAERGIYLPEQIEEDWSRPRREYLNGLVRDGVHRWTAILWQTGHVEEAIVRLRSYWLEHPTDEDALRPLLEMLGEQERFGEAEDSYAKAQTALREDEHTPDDRTKETIEAVRALRVRRASGAQIAPAMRAFPSTAFPAFLPLQEQGSFSSFSHALTGRIIETFCAWEGTSPMTFDPSKRATLQHLVAAFSALSLGQQLVNAWFEKNEVTEDAPSPIHSSLDIDLVSRHIDALQTLLLKGEPRFVLQASQEVYQKIQQAERSQKDVRLAEVALQAGLLVANAQEYALPWYQRDKAIIQTYDSIEQNVLQKYPEKGRFDRAYAQILAKRGRQHRVLWLFEYCERECARGLALANQLNDYPLRIHFLCERAHIEATSGDDTAWMRELETARQGVLDLPWIEREKAFHQIDYMQGEGYKRLAFHTRKDFSLDLRQKYATLALDHLASWDGMTIEVPGFETLVAALSRTQCFVLLDPEQAIRFAEQQKPLIETYYPTLLAKIHRILFLAQQRLQMNDQQFAQVFQGTTYAAYQSGSNLL
ncbi:MAG TPA: BTAD domain-containing putative transcriptional regulator [Ktedonobacteraceae bacterium]|nr:BTAD domain-containing putative transcriptional regulator [Ktedonobacteraceae bacterium]